MEDTTICNTCHKTFKSSANLRKHTKRKIPCLRNNKMCINCGSTFATKSSLNRHVKNVCRNESIQSKIKTMEDKIKEDIKTLDTLKEDSKVVNNNNQNNNNNTNNNNLTMNVITKEYILGFSNTPCIKALKNYDDVRAGNMILEPEYEDENIMFVNTIHNQYIRNKLSKYLGNIIVSFYKRKDITQQSFWCSDLSRLKFLVRVFPTGSTNGAWVTDGMGLIVKDEVIRPLLDYVVKSIDQYRITHLEKLIIDNDKFLSLSEIVTSIGNDSLLTQIIKYIAPHFTLGKKLTDKPATKQLPENK